MARTPIHPGEILREELELLDMSAAEFARQLNVPTNRITGILNEERAVTADTALRLGHWFGTSAEMWLNMQNLYELRLAEQEVGAEIRKLPKPFRLTYTLKDGSRITENHPLPMQRAIDRAGELFQRCGANAVEKVCLEGPDDVVRNDSEIRRLTKMPKLERVSR